MPSEPELREDGVGDDEYAIVPGDILPGVAKFLRERRRKVRATSSTRIFCYWLLLLGVCMRVCFFCVFFFSLRVRGRKF